MKNKELTNAHCCYYNCANAHQNCKVHENEFMCGSREENVSFFEKKEKEVIQPQVPLRLPCDDLTHLTELKFGTTKMVEPHLSPARVV